MNVLSFWRACHEEPLKRAFEFLSGSAQQFDKKAVIAKRLKRTPSIVNKLRRFDGMKLKNMQDIGGCRAIVSNEKRVRKLVRELRKRKLFKMKDYIKDPKESGYRSIHLVGNFANTKGEVRSIELQVRTAAQHAWATAVEIIDLFTGEAIKTNQGSEDWTNFFKSAGAQLSLIEDIPLYNSISQPRLVNEIYLRIQENINAAHHKVIARNSETLYVLSEKLDIIKRFNAFANSLKAADDHLTKVPMKGYILLEINVKESKVASHLFDEARFKEGADAYLEAEKRAAHEERTVVALVSTDAVGGIKEAYPNYFADSSIFTRYIAASTEAYKIFNPSGIARTLKKLFG